MGAPGSAAQYRPVLLAANHTATMTEIKNKGLFVLSAGGCTLTIPAPVQAYWRNRIAIASLSTNSGNTAIACGTAFLNGNTSITQYAGEILELECQQISATAFAWAPLTSLSTGTASNIAALIHAATGKTSPVGNDELGLIDSAASFALKKLTITNLLAAIIAAWGGLIDGLTGKTTPVDGDEIVIADSEDTLASKKLTWANIKATLKTYLDTLYQAIPAPATFTPTLAWTTATPDLGTPVYRQQTVGKVVSWVLDIPATDGKGATLLDVTFPSGLVPANITQKVPCSAEVSVNNGAFAQVPSYVIADDSTAGNRVLHVITGTLTNGQAARVIVRGFHEIP